MLTEYDEALAEDGFLESIGRPTATYYFFEVRRGVDKIKV